MARASSLSISGLLPIPLRERLSGRVSDVWETQQEWRQGERISVQAPSGTGKTTLIHFLYGLRNDYTGTVSWNGEDLRRLDGERIAALRRNEVSIVFQDLRLFPQLSAWENLELKRSLTNTMKAGEVRSWLDALGIADRAGLPAATLSYGEQQRLVIIRALLQPFRWLLMDEPFSHLDAANTEKAAALIGEVAARNSASFLIADLDQNTHFEYTKTLRL